MNKSKLAFITLIVLSLSFLFFFYGKILIHPNLYLFTDKGDGLKSFYVYNYHIVNDPSYINTKSINYPYGESHVYSDGQIVIANTVKILSKVFPGIALKSIGIINEMVILSFLFGIIILYGILRLLNVPYHLSIFGSFAIGILSPQLFRMLGHPTLPYVAIFPLAWYLYIKFTVASNKWLFSILIAVLLSIVPFIHGYYVLICALFLFFNWVISALQDWKKIKQIRYKYVHFILQVIVPLVIFQVYQSLTDTHVGRSPEPYGFFVATANLTTVFIPTHPPFKSVFSYFHEFKYQNWEGWSYIGLSMVFVALFSLVKIVRYIFKRRYKLIFRPVLPDILKSSIWAAVLMLFYSFAYPFKLHLTFLLDILSPLKQFRALGRFAWVFYYVFGVYGIYVLYLISRYFAQKKMMVMVYTIQIAFFLALFVEGYAHHSDVAPQASKAANLFKKELLPVSYKNALANINAQNYQAILALPYYHIGSEGLTREGSDSSMKVSMGLAFYANMSLMNSSCARTSLNESRKLMQLFAPTFIQKEALPDFKDKRPILIVYNREVLRDDENNLLKRSHKIYESANIELYNLPLDSLFANTAHNEIVNFSSIKDSLSKNGQFMTKHKDDVIFFDNFDNSKSEQVYEGNGAFEGVMKNYNVFLNQKALPLIPDKVYIASYWYYSKGYNMCANMAVVEEREADDQNVEWTKIYNTAECSNVVGDWMLIEMKFKIKKAGNKISIFLKGDETSNNKIYVDNLLIRPADKDVYSIIQQHNGKINKLFKNNFVIMD